MSAKKKEPPHPILTTEQVGTAEKLIATGKAHLSTDPPQQEEAVDAKLERRKETSGEEKSISFQVTTKDAILLYLWVYSGSTPDRKAEIMESREVLKKGLVDLKVLDIDRNKGTYRLNITRSRNYSQELIDQHLDQPWTRLAVAEIYGFKEEFLKANREQDKPQHIKTGKHLVSQYLGPVDPQTKLNFAETLERYTRETGLTMGNRPLGWGLNLNFAEQRVTHAILEAFSRDEYQGQITLPKEEVLTDPERGPHILPGKWNAMGPGAMARKAYKDIPHLPTIRLTLAEIVKLAGYDHDRQGDKQKVMEAIDHLRSHLYLFWWKRKAFKIVNGVAVPDRDAKGEHKWEEREDISPLFRIVFVRDEQTKVLKYFEISPSAVVLDQVNPTYGGNYFLMVPRDLHTQVVKAVGKGQRSSSYTFAFLVYLHAEYERISRHAKKGTAPKHTIAKPWEEITQRIKMPESVWKRKRANAVARLEQVYQVAKELGYLKSYRMDNGVDVLELEPSKYYRPEKEKKEEEEEAQLGSG